jgi:hypothetical protein
MPDEKSEKKSLKRKAREEFEQVVILTAYLAFFFCALATYSMLLLNKFHISSFAYATALINAAVIAKVILIGEAVRAGRKFEGKPVFFSAIWKSFVFGWLVFAFHIVEEMIKSLVHGKGAIDAFREIRLDDLLSRSVIIFCTFIPLFVFRELRRVMGRDNFRALFFDSPPKVNS